MWLAWKGIENEAPANSALRLDFFTSELAEFFAFLFADQSRGSLFGSCYSQFN